MILHQTEKLQPILYFFDVLLMLLYHVCHYCIWLSVKIQFNRLTAAREKIKPSLINSNQRSFHLCTLLGELALSGTQKLFPGWNSKAPNTFMEWIWTQLSLCGKGI